MYSIPTAALKVILVLPPLGIYIEEYARQETNRLNCSGEDLARFGHSEVFKKMTYEWPGNKIVAIIACWKKVFC
jgi:hypothetical protein